MKRVISKYDLLIVEKQTFTIPASSKILKIKMQYGKPRLWVLTDPAEAHSVQLTIEFHATGEEIDTDVLEYVDTIDEKIGMDHFMFHVFKHEEAKKLDV